MIEAPHIELESLSLSAAREKVRTGEVSAVSLAEQHFERIAAADGPIHSFLALSKERALAQAARVDAAAKAGEPLAPLAGVPVGIKDVLTMRGVAGDGGLEDSEGYHPPYDATAVERLEAAGAVLLGKLNCDEFAMGSSNENSAYGPVRNPRALDRVPGGTRAAARRRRLRRALRGVAGHGHGRIDSPAGGVLRSGRRAADVRARLALRADCVCVVAGPRGTVCDERLRDAATMLERARGQGRAGRDQLRAAGRRLCRRAEASR